MNDAFIRVKVWGDLACFSRPEMKVERVSYEVMTPSAARGVLDAIMWKPEMRWHIRKIEVLKPIRFLALKRNEIQNKTPVKGAKGVTGWMKDPSKYQPQPAGAGADDATPRNTLALRDVAYIIAAEPKIFSDNPENNPGKYIGMMERRVEKGQFFHAPCLGCREFAAHFGPPSVKDEPWPENRDLGWMLYDIAFDSAGKKNQAAFFRARLENGVMETRAEQVIDDENLRREVLKCSFKH